MLKGVVGYLLLGELLCPHNAVETPRALHEMTRLMRRKRLRAVCA